MDPFHGEGFPWSHRFQRSDDFVSFRMDISGKPKNLVDIFVVGPTVTSGVGI